MRKVTKMSGEIPEDLGGRIAYIRTNKGLSQEELAEKIFIKRELLNMIENGTRLPKIEVLKDIAKILNTTTDFLLCLSDVKTRNSSTQQIHNATGLSEKAIENLRTLLKSGNDTSVDAPLYKPLEFINALLEDKAHTGALFIICSMVGELLRGNPSDMSKSDIYKMDGGRYWSCENALTELIKELVKKRQGG